MRIDAIQKFKSAIAAAGLEAPQTIEPGRILRFPGAGKGAGNRSGWCLLFDDLLGGAFGDWSTGLHDSWHAKQKSHLSAHQRAEICRKVEQAKLESARLRAEAHHRAASKARYLWDRAPCAPGNHPYLLAKGIPPFNARLEGSALILPITDFSQSITSLQYISTNGQKKLLPGGRKKGCFITVSGNETTARRIVICEGWATGCTLAISEPEALVLAAIDAGNLKTVATGSRFYWPSAEIIIAGDDDRQTVGNPGAKAAEAAACAIDAKLALPDWPPDAPTHLSDFNDLANWMLGGDV